MKSDHPVPAAANIRILADDCDVVGIDKRSFLMTKSFRFAMPSPTKAFVLIVAGLDMDYKATLLAMPNLMATAEYVTKVHAVCTRTGNLAQYSFRKSDDENLVFLGRLASMNPSVEQHTIMRWEWAKQNKNLTNRKKTKKEKVAEQHDLKSICPPYVTTFSRSKNDYKPTPKYWQSLKHLPMGQMLLLLGFLEKEGADYLGVAYVNEGVALQSWVEI